MAIELTIDGTTYSENDLTLGEMEELEELLGGALAEADHSRVKNLTAIVFILVRNRDPDFTLEDARKVKIGSLGTSGEDDDPPADAAAKAAAPKGRSARARSGAR